MVFTVNSRCSGQAGYYVGTFHMESRHVPQWVCRSFGWPILIGKCNNTKPPVGVSPLLFHSPDGPEAVGLPDMPLVIPRLSLLRSDIAAGLSQRELKLLAHSRRPLAHRRPHRQYTVLCVCVCVCV